MIVEPSVLTEPTVTENESYSKVKEQLETWEEGVSGMSCCEIWHVRVGMYTTAVFLVRATSQYPYSILTMLNQSLVTLHNTNGKKINCSKPQKL